MTWLRFTPDPDCSRFKCSSPGTERRSPLLAAASEWISGGSDVLDWQIYLDQNQVRFDAELLEFLRIPSVSTAPERADDVRRAAEGVRRRLRAAGVPFVETIETPRHPVVFGRWVTGDNKPTLLSC